MRRFGWRLPTPQLTNYIVRGLVTAQPRNVGLEFRTIKTFVLRPVWDRRPTVPLGRTLGKDFKERIRPRSEGGSPWPYSQGQNFQLKIRIGALTSRTHSCHLHTTALVTRSRSRAGSWGISWVPMFSHHSPTWMAEGT